MKERPSFPVRLDISAGQSRVRQPAPRQPQNVPRQRENPPNPGLPQGLGLDSSTVRMNMVHKLASQGLADRMVLSAMQAVERHRFVDSALVNQAYEDTSLPIGFGQTISKPSVVGRMTELLHQSIVGKLGRVLEIGTGCGYQAAVLSHLADEVFSIERLRGLHTKARDNLRYLRLVNLHLLLGDGMAGYAKGAPYAAIIAAASAQTVPQPWIDQLAVGGRLVAPVCTNAIAGGGQALLVIDKTAHGWQQTVLEGVHFVPLKLGLA